MDNKLLIPTKELLLVLNLTSIFVGKIVSELGRDFPIIGTDPILSKNYERMMGMLKVNREDFLSLFQYVMKIDENSFVLEKSIVNEALFISHNNINFRHCLDKFMDTLSLLYDEEFDAVIQGIYCSLYLNQFDESYKKFNEKEEIIKELRKERS